MKGHRFLRTYSRHIFLVFRQVFVRGSQVCLTPALTGRSECFSRRICFTFLLRRDIAVYVRVVMLFVAVFISKIVPWHVAWQIMYCIRADFRRQSWPWSHVVFNGAGANNTSL